MRVPFDLAAALPQQGLTAYGHRLLESRASVGKIVLLPGAS